MNEIAKNIMCISIRNGVELWIEKERIEKLMMELENNRVNRFIRIDNQIVNMADIVGIFTPEIMDEKTRLKNGQWRCLKSTWHDRGQKCDCGKFRFDFNGKKVEEFVQGQGWIKL